MIFTKELFTSVSTPQASEVLELAGVDVRLHLTVVASGGAATFLAVEVSFDGVHFKEVFNINAGTNTTFEVDGPSGGASMKFVRLSNLVGSDSTLTATLTAFE